MRIFALFAAHFLKGLSIDSALLRDPEEDRLELSSVVDNPVTISFWGDDPISYNGTPVESLQLAPNAIFVGYVAGGDIIPEYGELTPIPRVKAEPVNPPFTSTFMIENYDLTLDQVPAYRRAQRQAHAKLDKVLRELKEKAK